MSKTTTLNRIGVLTSGGDAPGMNAAIRGVVRTASCLGIDCVGIKHGYAGLIRGDFINLDLAQIKGITGRGGTMLYTARSSEFNTPEGVKQAADTCNHMGIQGIVVIGGDGTFRGAMDLTQHGISVIGIPCTIDNDIGCTTYTIGFDTACNTAVDAVDRLNDTMQSHERCSVVEVMGRRAGHLALGVGIATGATIILVPEVEYDFEKDVVERIRVARLAGRNNFTVIVAEGAEPGLGVAEKISESTGIDTRFTALGHIQRGGSPHVRDRVVGTSMGFKAVTLLAAGRKSCVIAMRGDRFIDLDFREALALTKEFDYEMYKSFSALTFLDKNTLLKSFKST
ncbi:MAG: 6-phosphofructokinase [Oscillospiraceae bacterium]|jgi:6-phosphofructokinase 1|nr:6-phosphofructokinase [Oscillospiraceae bacterium]